VSNDETVAEAAGYSKAVKSTFPVVHDPHSVIYKLFRVQGAPANVLVDRSGSVLFSQEEGDLPKLQAAVEGAMGAS
jgi:hypothetical protein